MSDTTEALRREVADKIATTLANCEQLLTVSANVLLYRKEARAIIDALSRIATLEAERDEALKEHTCMTWELRRAEERATALEVERDTAREEAARWKASYTRAAEQCTQACERRQQVEAENARLRTALEPGTGQAEGWQPIEECPPDARKIIGWCLFGANFKEGEARECQRYVYHSEAHAWMAHGCTQRVTHFKPWPDDAPAPPKEPAR